MYDPFSWSFPIGRLFGIGIRVHFLFPLVAAGLILRVALHKEAAPGAWVDVAMVLGLLFFTVFWHEMGHCYAGWRVGGDAHEVLLWPLGGLAAVDVPHSPSANFIVAFGGPAVNLIICLAAAVGLGFACEQSWQPPWNPFWAPFYINAPGEVELTTWGGVAASTHHLPTLILARLFWVSWANFLLNVLLIGFPLDGGRMFQAVMWHYVGYRQATYYAVIAGFVTMFVVIFGAMVGNEIMPLLLAWFIYTSCKQQWIVLETGGEDSVFGYDFSQGYTSLERDQPEVETPPAPPRRRQGFWQRWAERRAERKRQRDEEQRVADERRMDELLDKIQRLGKASLTDEENRFLKRVAEERYKHRP